MSGINRSESCPGRLFLCQQVFDDATVNIRQPHVSPPESVRQLLVLKTELMKDRGVNVVDIDGVADY